MPHHNDDLGTDEGGAAHTCGRAAAQAVWFATLREKLPPRLRQLCLARLEAVIMQPSQQGGGGGATTSPAKAECLAEGAALTWPKPRPKMRLKELKERAAARVASGGARATAMRATATVVAP